VSKREKTPLSKLRFIISSIIIIIIIVIISFMQRIFTFIPETNYVLREYSVAAILLLLFMVHISVSALYLLYFYIIIIIIIIIIITLELSLGGSSPYTSTDKTNKNK
jgi:hypothetical protein